MNTEKDVEHQVRKIIERVTGATFSSPNNTDGYLEFDHVRLLLETKLNLGDGSKALAQTIHYVHTMRHVNLILLADARSFIMVAPLDLADHPDVDWTRAPSSPCPELTRLISEQGTLQSEDLSTLGDVFLERARSLAQKQKVEIDSGNMERAFAHFADSVLSRVKHSAITEVDLFISCITRDDGDAYVHPRKVNTLVVDTKEYAINVKAFRRFFSVYKRGYSPSQIDMFQATRDRLIEGEARRRQGAFFTPSIWVDEAHQAIEDALGASWRDECIVWDPCAGTANLTRDYDFQDLILSSLEESDISTIRREGYNTGAQAFQYDFLNPEVGDNDLPRSVKKMLKDGAEQGKRLVFLMNPPYAEDGVAGAKGKSRKGVASTTLVNKTMPKLGRANRQLYAQFLFQCEQVASEYGYEEKAVGIFCKPTFMTSSSFAKFRSFWYRRYSYQSGFMFQASHFADVSGAWGVSFTLWNEGNTEPTQNLPITLKDSDAGGIIALREKALYSATGREASKWVSALSPKTSSTDTPKFSSGLKVREVEGNDRGTAPNGLGIMCNKANSPMKSATDVFFLSGKPTDKGCCNFDLTEGEGWRRAIALYSARKLVNGNWINDKDEYLAPQTDKEGYEQWVDDCHVYTLLHSSNNMTSMRDVRYREKTWQIHNQFFWLTREEALQAYDHADALPMYRDARKSRHEPYFASILSDLNLSPLAQEILDDLNAILRDPSTHKARTEADPSEHALSWDIGVYQLNRLLKGTEAWVLLKEKHLRLRDQLQDGVYTYGFLKR